LSSSLWAMTAMEDLALRSGFLTKLCANAAPLPTSSRSTRYRASYEFCSSQTSDLLYLIIYRVIVQVFFQF